MAVSTCIWGFANEAVLLTLLLLNPLEFRLAKELVVGPRSMVGLEQAEKLVIDAEREFFDNSTTGNMNADNMKKAWEW